MGCDSGLGALHTKVVGTVLRDYDEHTVVRSVYGKLGQRPGEL